jgi:hypothetical protein
MRPFVFGPLLVCSVVFTSNLSDTQGQQEQRCSRFLVSEMRELRHKSGNGSNIIGVPTVEMGMVRRR